MVEKVTNITAARMLNQLRLASNMGPRRLADGRWYNPSVGGTKRNLYDSLGYIKTIKFSDYLERYERGDISSRIVDAAPNSCWRNAPVVSDSVDLDKGEETQFEEDLNEVLRDHQLYHYLLRLDRLCGVGQYGVLLFGIDDGKKLSEPIEPSEARNLIYLMPYTEGAAAIDTWETDVNNPRYGMPKYYNIETINFASVTTSASSTQRVHHSRVIHVADETSQNDIFGTPRLKKCFNRLQDLETIAGGSAEMYWRGAFPGLGLVMDEDAEIDADDKSEMDQQIRDYQNDLQRYLRLRGVEIKELSPQVSDPSKHVEIQISLISAATGIPKRILIGSERGELASSQDENNWNAQVESRQTDFVEPRVLRPSIDWLITNKIVSEPEEYYTVFWPPLYATSEEKQATNTKLKMEAVKAYVESGAEMLVPEEFFLKKFLGLNDDDYNEIINMQEGVEPPILGDDDE